MQQVRTNLIIPRSAAVALGRGTSRPWWPGATCPKTPAATQQQSRLHEGVISDLVFDLETERFTRINSGNASPPDSVTRDEPGSRRRSEIGTPIPRSTGLAAYPYCWLAIYGLQRHFRPGLAFWRANLALGAVGPENVSA